MKRLKLCLIILFCMMTDVIEAYDFVEGNIYYNILSESDRTVEVTIKGSYSTYTGDITIPSTVHHGYRTYTVTKIASLGKSSSLTGVTIPNSVLSIGEFAFSGCTGLTSIEIPVSVTSIGYYAFTGCTGLENIEIPNSVTSIESAVFNGCTKLTNIIIPNSVTSIGGSAFYGCTSLTNINIPNSVTSIGESAFSGCTSLTKLNIPYSVISIEESAFGNCSNLTSIIVNDDNPVYDSRDNCNAIIETSSNTLIAGCMKTIIPNTVLTIGDFAFDNCNGLTNMIIPNSVTTIGRGAFYSCANLTNINLPNSITTIEESTFVGCTALTNIKIPNSVTTIGEYAFSGCSGLTSIEIPNSVTTIGDYALHNCTGLSDVYLDCSTIGTWFRGFTSIKQVHLGDHVESIKGGAFYGCSGLISINIPKSITNSNDSFTYGVNGQVYGDRVFEGCNSLTDVYIDCPSIGNWFKGIKSIKNLEFGNNVKFVEPGAFSGCTGIYKVELSNSIGRIDSKAFEGCTNITELIIPNSVESMSNDSFEGCINLTDLRINSTTIDSWFSGFSQIKNVYIGNDTKNINDNAFNGCTGLTCIEIGNSINSIGYRAFYNCTGLKKVVVPDIASWCNINFASNVSNPLIYACHLFNGESSEIINLVIPNSVTSIGSYAFIGCSSIENIEIANSVSTIGSYAFSGCSSLENVVIANSVSSIGSYAFNVCSSLKNVEIPNTVTSIGSYAFNGCSSLTNAQIGNSVNSIGNYAFGNCMCLTDLIIPGSVTTIGEGAFYGCDNIDVVYSLVTKVFTIDEHAFSDIVFNNANLYVPKGKLATYQGTNYWSKFLNIHEGAPTEIGDLDRAYKLKVSDAGMATMYLDYPVAIPDNDDMLGVFYVSSMSDHILKLKRLKETIPANCGVIVMANTGTFTFKETLMSTDVVEENLLTGTTKKVNVADIPGDVYTLGHGKRTGYMGFFKYTGATMPANKAYLVLNADEEEDDVLVIDRDSYADIFDATNISFVVDEEDTPIIYDLQGRRVENPSKGIYIVNGKKVYIK